MQPRDPCVGQNSVPGNIIAKLNKGETLTQKKVSFKNTTIRKDVFPDCGCRHDGTTTPVIGLAL